MKPASERLVDGMYTFQDLVDISRLRKMFERFSQATGFTTGLVTHPEQELLISTGWRDICVKFHRALPDSERHCKRSNVELTAGLKEQQEYNIHRCANGLVDGATPIIIHGVHVANLFTGQILFERADADRFSAQAAEYGYDGEAYLAALREVPVVTEEAFLKALGFLSEMAVMLAEQGLARFRTHEAARRATESEEKLRTTIDSIGDAIITTDTCGAVAHMNPVAIRLTGWSFEDARGMPLGEVFCAEEGRTGAPAAELLQRALDRGESVQQLRHARLITRGGAELQISASAAPHRGIEGGVNGVVLSFRDISEEHRLRQDQQRLAAIMEQTAEGIAVADMDGVIQFTNSAWARMHGYDDRGELVGKHLSVFHTEQQVREIVEPFNLEVMRRGHHAGEVEHVRRDGSTFHSWMTSALLRDEQGVPSGMVGSSMDMTERKLAEEELRRSEAKFRGLVESTSDWIWEVDARGAYVYASPQVEAILGYTPQEVLGRTLFEFIRPEESERVELRFKELSGRAAPIVELENSCCHRDGRRVVLETSGVPILDSAGRVIGYRGIDRDVTASRQVEAERRRLEEQYQQTQKVESIGRLAAGVAHDLNNLLSPIIGFGELLLEEMAEGDGRRGLVGQILGAGGRARDLVRQLQAFSRRQTLEVKPLNLNRVVASFETLLRRTIREDIELRLLSSPDIRMIKADIGSIEQVIMNLAINAADAMPGGGVLSIKTSGVELSRDQAKVHPDLTVGAYVVMTVTDTGKGMDRETREKLFEPFFSTKGEQGTGLGLATVYGIIKQHGGHIAVHSALGEGTTFEVYLPVAEGAHPVDEPRGLTPQEAQGGWETILLVEDNSQVRLLSQLILRQHGYQVLVAESGAHALTLLASHDGPVHLLLTDVVMPGMNGKELFNRLFAKLPGLRVLYMSGYTDDVIAHRGVLEKETAFLQKPFNVQALASKVREVLDQG